MSLLLQYLCVIILYESRDKIAAKNETLHNRFRQYKIQISRTIFHDLVRKNIMITIQEIENTIASLTRAEKATLLQWIVQDLGDAFPGIESSPGICGGEPRIVRTRIPVWSLEQARRLGASDAELLKSYPTLRAEDLVHAWAYVRSHRLEIEQQIEENEAA